MNLRLPAFFLIFVCGFIGRSSFAQSTVLLPPDTLNPVCIGVDNGSITFQVTGTATDFFFSWSGGNLPTNGNPVSGDGLTTQTGLRAGDYFVFIRDNNQDIDTTIFISLKNQRTLTLSAGNDINNCLGQPVNLSAASNAIPGSTFTWSYNATSGPKTLTGQTASIPASPSPDAITVSGPISVVVTDPAGCTASNLINVTVNIPPLGFADPDTQSICPGIATVTLTSDQSTTTYTWTVSRLNVIGASGGSGLGISQNLRPSGTTTGRVTYNIRPVSPVGCVGPLFRAVVFVRAKPIGGVIPDSAEICSGNSTNFVLSSNLTGTTFEWKASGSQASGFSDGSGNVIAQTLEATTSVNGNVVYQVTGIAEGCRSDSFPVVAIVKPIPVLSVAPSDTVALCPGLSQAIDYTSDVANALIAWTVEANGTGAVSGTGNSHTQTYLNPGNTVLNADFSAFAIANGCTSEVKQHRVKVLPQPEIQAIAVQDSICAGDSVSIQLISSLPNTTFTWTSASSGVAGNGSGNGELIKEQLGTQAQAIGSVTYTIEASTPDCPAVEISKTIFVKPRPVISVLPARDTICSGNSTSIALSADLAETRFSWTAQATGVNGAADGTGSSISQQLINALPGLDSVRYVVTGSFRSCEGAAQNADVLVQRSAPPVPSNPSPVVCSGTPVEVNLTPADSWSWIVSSGSAPGAGSGSGGTFTQTLQNTGSTDLSVQYQIFGVISQCPTDTLVLPVTVKPNPVLSVLASDDSLCSGESLQLDASTVPSDNALVSWTVQADNVQGASDGSGNLVQQTLSLLSGNLGSVRYQFTSERDGCRDTLDKIIVVSIPAIPFDLGQTDSTLCDGDSLILPLSAQLSGISFSWTVSSVNATGAFAGSGSEIRQKLTITDASLGDGFVDYVITPSAGTCIGQPQTKRIFVNNLPDAPVITIVSGASPVCPGDSIVLSSSASSDNQWLRNGIAIAAPAGIAQVFAARDSGNYAVSFTSPEGCSALSSPVRLDVRPVPSEPVISGPEGFCAGSSAVLKSSSSTDNQWQLNGVDIAGANDTLLVVSQAGSYTVRLASEICTIRSSSFQVSEFSLPEAAVISGPSAFCSGSSATLTSSASSGNQWFRDGFLIAGQTAATLQASSAGNYTVSVTDSNSCSATSAGFALNADTSPGASTINGPLSVCNGGTVTLTASSNINYQWLFNGQPVAGADQQSIQSIGFGGYRVVVVQGACSDTSVTFTLLQDAPDFTVDSSVSSVSCLSGIPADNGQISLTAQGGSGNFGFAWTPASLPAQASQSGLAPGNYSVVVTDQVSGCFENLSFTIAPAPVIFPNASLVNDTRCDIDNGSISLSPLGSPGPFGYTWTGRTETGPSISGISSGSYEVSIIDSTTGCIRLVSDIQIGGADTLAVQAGVSEENCSGPGGIMLQVSGGSGQFSYSWSGSGSGLVSGASSQDNLTAGVYSVTILDTITRCVRNLNNLEVQKTSSFNLQAQITNPSLCNEPDGFASAITGLTGVSYRWKDVLGNVISSDSVLTGIPAGTYELVAEFGECLDSLGLVLNNPALSLQTNITQVSGCGASNGAISLQLANAGGSPSFSWTRNGQVFSSQQNLSGLFDGEYKVVVNANGCLDSTTATILPSGAFTFNTQVLPAPTCLTPDGSILINPSDGSGQLNYSWTRIPSGSAAGGDSARLAGAQSGFYKVVISNSNCRDSAVIALPAVNQPVLQDSLILPGICGAADGRIIIADSALYAGQTAQWFRNGNFIASGFSVSGLSSGQYQFLLSNTLLGGPLGCDQPYVFELPQGGGLGLSAMTDSADCNNGNGSAMIMTESGLQNLTYTWKKSGNPSFVAFGSEQNNLSSGDYTVVVSGPSCVDSVSFSIGLRTNCQPCDLPIFFLEKQPTTCFSSDGMLVACVIGAMDDATFLWTDLSTGQIIGNNDTITGIPAGNFRVTVNQGSCVASANYGLRKDPPPYSISFTTQSATCANNDGSVTAIISGDLSPNALVNISSVGGGFSADSVFASGLSAGEYRISVTDGFCFASRAQIFVSKPAFCGPCALNVITASNPVLCSGSNDGQAVAFIESGGFGPFTYSLNGGPAQTKSEFLTTFSNQPAGPFTVVVVDQFSGCTDTVQNVIGTQLTMGVSVFTEKPGCDTLGGKIQLTIGGATPPYSVILSGDTLFRNAGVDTLISVDGDTSFVNVVDTLVTSFADTVTSADGLASFSGLESGYYQASVQSSEGCITIVRNINLIGVQPVALALADVKSTSCVSAADGSFRIRSLSGSPSYTYFLTGVSQQIMPLDTGMVISGLKKGTYNLRVMGSSSCDLDTTVTIPGPDSVMVFLGTIENSVCNDSAGTVRIDSIKGGAGAPWIYTLIRDGVFYGTDTLASDSLIRDLSPGNYQLVFADTNNCSQAQNFSIQIIQQDISLNFNASSTAICAGETVTFTASTSITVPNLDYYWYRNGSFIGANKTGVISLSDLFNGENIRVDVFLDGNCFNPSFLSAQSGPIAVTPVGTTVQAGIQALGNTTVCEGASVTLEALNPNGIPNLSYTWLVDGQPVDGQTQPFFQYTPATASSQVSVRLTALSGSGCLPTLVDESDPVQITRLQSIVLNDSIFVVSPADSDLICVNTPVTLALKTNLKGLVPFQTDWYRNNNYIGTSSDTSITLNGFRRGDRVRAFVRFEPFYDCLITNNGSGSNFSQEITINIRPSVDDSIRPPSACGASDGLVILRDSARFAGKKVRWYQNEIPFSRTFRLSNVPAGTYQLYVSDTVNNGDFECSFTLNITIPDGKGLGLTAMVDSANCQDEGGMVTIMDSLMLPGLTYTWTKAGDPGFTASGKSQNNLSSGNYTVIAVSSLCSDTIEFTVPKANICDTACNIPIFVYEVQPSTCFSSDGALVACAIGAMEDASYSWFSISQGTLVGNDDTLRNIPAGLYRITVSQNGCSASKEYLLQKSPVPYGISPAVTNATCANNDGRITVSVSNVSPAFTVQIVSLSSGVLVSDSLVADSLPAGDYRIIVNDGFCSDSRLVKVEKPVFCGPCQLQAEAASNPVYCPGVDDGRAFAIVTSGGNGPFQYILNFTDTLSQTQFLQIFPNQPIGPFTVVVQDLTTQCKDTVSDFIGTQFALSAAVSTIANDCDTAGAITVSLGGVPGPYTVILTGDTLISGTDTIRTSYSDTVVVNGLDTTFTGIRAGAYQVKVLSSEGCVTMVGGILLRLRTPVFLKLGEIRPVSCAFFNNGSITIDSLSGSDTYKYFIPGFTSDFQPLLPGQTISNLSAGTYVLRITGNRSCDLDTTIVIEGPDPLQFAMEARDKSLCADSAGSAKLIFLAGGNGGPYTYSLFRDGSFFRSDTLADDSLITGLPPGFYSMILNDTNLCNSGAGFTIESIRIPYQLNLTADTTKICAGDTVTFTASTSVEVPGLVYNWYRNGFFFSNSGPVQVLTDLGNAEFIYVEAFPDFNCYEPNSTQSQIISVQVTPLNASVKAGILGIDTVVCEGGLAVLQAQNLNLIPDVTYTWFVNGVEQSGGGGEFFTYVPQQAVDTVKVVVSANSGFACLQNVTDTSRNVLVITAPLTQVKDSIRLTSPGDSVFLCPNTPVTFTLNTSLQVPYSVEWFANGVRADSGTASTYTFNGLSDTVRIQAVVKFDTTLSCLATNGPAGVDSSQVFTLEFLPANDPRCLPCALDLRAQIQNLTCASNADGVITAQVTGGTGAYLYSLIPGGPQDTTSAVFSGLLPGVYGLAVRDTITQCVDTLLAINVVSQNNYAVSLAFENSCSCVDSTDGMIEVVSVEDGSGDNGKYLYSLTPGYPDFSSLTMFENLSPDTFLLQVKDTITGCITSVTRIIGRKAPVDAFLSLVSGVSCNGGSDGSIRLDSIANGSGFYQVSTSGDPGTFVPVEVGDTLGGFASGDVFLYIRDLKTGCVDSNFIFVPQPALLSIGLTLLDTTSCVSSTGKVKVGPVAGGVAPYSYLVQYPDSVNFQPLTLPADSILTNLGGGSLLVTVTDANGCTLTGIITIPVDRPVIGNISLTSPCLGDTNGIIRLSGMSGGTAPYTFTLINGLGQVVATQSDSVFTGLLPDSYNIGIKDATGAAGCENLYTRTLNPTDTLRFNLVRFKASTCDFFDGEAVFVLQGGQKPYRFSFDSTAGQFTVFRTITGDTLKITGLSARIPGEFYTLRIRDNGPDGGCSYDTTFVQPGQAPLQYQLSKKDIKCFGEASGSVILSNIRGTGPLVLRVRRVGSEEVIAFDTLEGSFFQNASFELGGIPAGDFNLEVKQFGLCSGSKSVPFTLSQPTEIIISARMFRKSANGFKLGGVRLDSVNGGSSPYLLTFNGGSAFTYSGDTLFRNLNPGEYTIRVQDDSGCVAEKEVECEDDDDLFVPNLFTPNGDGLNDRLEIRNLPAGSRFLVKDRWGKEVFRSDDYKNDWAGADQEAGTYFWLLEINGQGERSGWVTIER